jgi:hypothetical protein
LLLRKEDAEKEKRESGKRLFHVHVGRASGYKELQRAFSYSDEESSRPCY